MADLELEHKYNIFMTSDLWVDKWCPKTLDEYVLNEDIKDYFRKMLKKNTI